MQYHAEKSPAHQHKPLATVGPTQEAMASAEGNKAKETPAGFQNARARARARTQNGNFVSIEFFPPLFFFSCKAQQSRVNKKTDTDLYKEYRLTERRYFYQESLTNCWGVDRRGGGKKRKRG